MSIVGGFYEAGQDAPGFQAGGVIGPLQLGLAHQATQELKASGADIAIFASHCTAGKVSGCQALLIRQKELGLDCDASGVEAMYPGALSCSCETSTCTPLGANGANGVNGMMIPPWIWYAGAGVLAWWAWRAWR